MFYVFQDRESRINALKDENMRLLGKIPEEACSLIEDVDEEQEESITDSN